MVITRLTTLRLSHQRIRAVQPWSPDVVVRWMGAIQAQDYHQSAWAVGLRTPGASLSEVERMIAEGRIVRTWTLRGTLHFVSAEDAGWMARFAVARLPDAARRSLEQLGLDEALLERCGRLIYDALSGRRRLTRPAVMSLLQNAGIAIADQRGYRILRQLAQDGLICLGPRQGRQQTFVLLDEWAQGGRDLTHAEALADLAARYFASRGPATLRDFAWWAGVSAAEARAGLDAIRRGLVAEMVDGQEYWMAPGVAEGTQAGAGGVYLLPGFDEYLLGYTDRGAALPAEFAQRLISGSVFLPFVVSAGQVVGTWRRDLEKGAAAVRLSPFDRLPALPGELLAAARRYADFLGLPLGTLELGASGLAAGDAFANTSRTRVHAPGAGVGEMEEGEVDV